MKTAVRPLSAAVAHSGSHVGWLALWSVDEICTLVHFGPPKRTSVQISLLRRHEPSTSQHTAVSVRRVGRAGSVNGAGQRGPSTAGQRDGPRADVAGRGRPGPAGGEPGGRPPQGELPGTH